MATKSSLPRLLLGLFLLVLFVALLWIVTAQIGKTINNAISPFQQVNDQLSTQVFQLLHPTPTVIPDPVTIINEVRAIARLETIQYTVEKVITAEINQGLLDPLFGDRLLFVAHGYVIAGLDMSKINSQDLWLEDDSLYVHLPEPEILVATLDNEKSYVYDRDTGMLTHGDPNLETTARQVAEQEILNAALEDGILEQARINGEIYLERFFNALGYDRVIFSQETP